MNLPRYCLHCHTDDFAPAHLRARQQDAAAIIALYGPQSPEMRRASLRVVEAMAVMGRRIACKATHPVAVEVHR